MSGVLIFIEAITIAVVVCFLNYFYGNWKKQHKIVTVVSFVSWYLPIFILCVIPIDISIAYYTKCQSDVRNNKINSTEICSSLWFYIDQNVLSVFWHIAYWTSFCLTWIFLPILQSYAKSGSFNILGKLKSALIDNAIYYGTYLFVVVLIGIYILIKKTISLNLSSIKLLIISASNTWGLLWVILFLGYGLVEVPRDVWNRSDNAKTLTNAYLSLPKLNIERLEEEEELEYLIRKAKHWSNQMSSNHQYRKYMDIILDKIEEAEGDIMQTVDGGQRRKMTQSLSMGDLRSNESDNIDDTVKLKTLEILHRSLKVTLHRYLRAYALWEDMVRQAIWLEDVEFNTTSGIRLFRKPGFIVHNSETSFNRFLSIAEWYWKCQFRPFFMKVLSVTAIIVSTLVVWSECTFWLEKPVLSVFANILQLSASFYKYFTIVFVSFLSLGYLSLCVYFTVFRLRIFNYFRLVPNHHSDENSLIFCGMLLCRLTPPLCLNYLGLVHLDSHILIRNSTEINMVETAYTKFMGHLDLIPLIANGFNLYFPLLVLILCLCTLLQLGEKILHFLGLQMVFGSYDYDKDSYSNIIEEGRILLKRERQTYDKEMRYLSSTESRQDYKSTVIEIASKDRDSRYYSKGFGSPFIGDTQTQKLLEENSDDWTPVEYNEEYIDKDYQLVTPDNSRTSRLMPERPNQSKININKHSFIKKLWPL